MEKPLRLEWEKATIRRGFSIRLSRWGAPPTDNHCRYGIATASSSLLWLPS